MNINLDRAHILLNQGRYDLAEKELRAAVGAAPDDAFAHALLAVTLSAQGKHEEALREAKEGIRLEPHMAFCHYVMADVLEDLERGDEAFVHVREAINLDPENASYRAMLSRLEYNRREWQKALDAAQDGLQLDPENVDCLNMRGLALVKLGRRAEAGESIDSALAREPENAGAHAVKGLALLEAGKHEEALKSFREALRLEPGHEGARGGVIECLKARNIVYRLMLRYFLFMSRLSDGWRWAMIIGLYLVYRVLYSTARTNAELAPFIWPLIVLYIVFMFLTWAADPIFNLMLRLNRFGRLVLSREEIVASNCVGGLILISAVSAVLGFFAHVKGTLLLALISLMMVIPVAAAFGASTRRNRWIIAAYSLGLAGLGIGAVACSMLGMGLGGTLFTGFLLGWVAFSWIGNLLTN